MEPVGEFQISEEYQIYSLFYCFSSCLKLKPCCQNMAANLNEQIQGRRESFPLLPAKKGYFLVSTDCASFPLF